MASRSMKTTPAMACLKTLLTIFSLIFLVIGLAFLVTGILAKVDFIMFDELSTTNFSAAPWVMIGVGCFIVLVGIMGCSATIKGNTCLLRTYGLLLGIIFICELAGAIVAIVFRGQVDTGFQDGMRNAVENYTSDADAKKAFDQAQSTLHCCGVENYTDWWTMESGIQPYFVPSSCCVTKDGCKEYLDGGFVNTTAVSGDELENVIYETGCHAELKHSIFNNLAVVIGTMFGVAFFQLLGLILACCLASSINANKYELV